MEELEHYKVKLNTQGLLIQSTKPLTEQEIQPLLDSSLLHQKTQLEHEKELDRQHQIYTLLTVSLLSLGLFSISFATVRTVSKYIKTSEVIRYVG